MQAVVDAFSRALAERGIKSGNLRADGQIHRCGTERKPRSRNGVYCLHLDGKVPAGWFQNHEDGLGVTTWRAEHITPMTEAERLAWRKEMAQRRAERETEQRQANLSAAQRAALIWERAKDISPDHPYLVRKRIGAHGIREHRGLAIVPLFNAVGGLVNLQFIAPDGGKKFLKGGQKQGCFYVIGEPDLDPAGLCIGEGFATMATVYEAAGYMSVVAFDCGNLKPVTLIWRKKLPKARIVICADNDKAGLSAADEIVRAVPNCAMVWPDFGKGRVA